MAQNKKSVIIIGAGIGGLGAAALLSRRGYTVTVLEKNKDIGGRATLLTIPTSRGTFVFDKGPSWYMMPDIFEHFYSLVGHTTSDFFALQRLAPSYRIFMGSEQKHYDFFSDIGKTAELFETLEKGSGKKFRDFMHTTEEQYTIAKKEFLSKNYNSIFDFLDWRVLSLGARLPLLKKQSTIISKLFSHEVLQKVLQYQTVLLGTSPFATPGIYTLMNYVDFVGGIWYPDKGIYEIPRSLESIAKAHGTEIITEANVTSIIVDETTHTVQGVTLADGTTLYADIVISNGDRQHTDQILLPKKFQEKTPAYWNKRTMAPSAFILYLGIDGKVPSLTHHNLLFSKNWKQNFEQIFDKPILPTDPSLYICAPSVTDPSVAPPDSENLFVLVPIASGLNLNEQELDVYESFVLDTIERECGIESLRSRLLVKQRYCINNFIQDYNAWKGSALGLAHTLNQTALLRPNNIATKVKNLYYVGAGTNPGIGMPICLLSAELVYKRIEQITHAHLLTEKEVRPISAE